MRPRKVNRGLPSRMYFKHGRHWYVYRGKWQKLSADYAEALKQYAALTSQPSEGMNALIDAFLENYASKKTEKTRKEYKRLCEKLRPVLVEFHPSQVKPHHIFKIIEHESKKPVQANRIRQLLSVMFAYAVSRGDCEFNPVKQVKGVKVEKRDRYITHEEFNAVREQSGETIQCLMDFCYFTAQRISDVLKVKRTDITEDGVYFEQGKTGKKLLVKMTPELQEVIDRTRKLHDKVKGLTLFHGRGGKPYSYFGISAMFRRALAKTEVKDFHIHDIRAKSLTDAKNQGLDAQKLAGHKSSAMTDHYVKARMVEQVDPPSFRQVVDKKTNSGGPSGT